MKQVIWVTSEGHTKIDRMGMGTLQLLKSHFGIGKASCSRLMYDKPLGTCNSCCESMTSRLEIQQGKTNHFGSLQDKSFNVILAEDSSSVV